MALSAQSFTVTKDGQTVESGSSFVIYGEGNDWGELNIEFDVTANENVRLIGEKVEINVIENTMNYFCFGQCLDPSVYVTSPYDMSAGMTEIFSAHYQYMEDMASVAGEEQMMQYYIYPANDPDNKFIINVTFIYSFDGVDDISTVEEFSNAYPTPASSVVNFDYSFSSNVSSAMIAVYNMMGQEVMRSDISGMSGKASLNVNDLADGIYFYSLVVNGKTEKSSKIVVRH